MDLTLSERDKYERMWANDGYRKATPDEEIMGGVVASAIELLDMRVGDSVVDYGCGPGASAKLFQNAGIGALGVDIAANSVDRDVPFIRACLWDLPGIESDWAFCTDVMEHIPEEKVETVLVAMRDRTRKGGYFRIHMGEDAWGKRVHGLELHVTIKPFWWWKNRIRAYWGSGMATKEGQTAVFICYAI